jgi:hypothetical protein
MRLMECNQFDTIYHEHFSYLSLLSCEKIFAAHEMSVFDVEEFDTHGGSLRLYVRHNDEHQNDAKFQVSPRLEALRADERAAGMHDLATYANFSRKVQTVKFDLLDFLIECRRKGKTVIGYGAPAKGNTLLNYCGVREDLLTYTVDRSPHKQGRFLPGTHIPIYHPNKIRQTRPDYLLILPWNIKEEVLEQMAFIREWGGKFVVPIPRLEIVE